MKIFTKKILFVTNSLSGGGAEDSAYAVYSELLNRGAKVKLCVLNSNSNDEIPDGVIALSRQWKSGVFSTYRCFINFKKIIEAEAPEVLVAHCELPEMFCAFVKSRGIKIICVEHTSRPWFRRRALGAVVRLILRSKSAQWVTVSIPPKEIWLGLALPVPIANPVCSPQGFSTMLSDSQIVFIGRLRKEKRPRWAIEAALKNDLKIALYGDGDELSSINESYSMKSSSVAILGFRKNPWKYIKSDALLIVPSEFEGDGLVVVECILRGNPLLVFDNEDLRRFNLPERNYFKSENDLIKKVSMGKIDRFHSLRPPGDLVDLLKHERDIELIGNKWEEILK
jgi:glycosyltransferase involved in cell wall biosynthesis